MPLNQVKKQMDHLHCMNGKPDFDSVYQQEVYRSGIPISPAAFAATSYGGSNGVYASKRNGNKVFVKKDSCSSYSSFPMAFTVGIIVGVLVALLLGNSNLAPGWVVAIATVLGYIVATMFCHKTSSKPGEEPSSTGCDITAAVIALLASWGVVAMMREYGRNRPVIAGR